MKRANKRASVQNRPNNSHNPKLPFIEHVYELRKRLFYVALSVGLWSTAAYFIQHSIVAVLLKPARDQQFIYTTVGGGIDFLFRVCIYTGIAFSIPVIVYQTLKYLQPLIKKDAVQFMALGSIASGALALLGMAFGYFFGLPAALNFLLHQFSSAQIEAMLSINSYMSFVTMYMLGSAFIFQLPLLLVLINRIKPLKPKKLLGMERWVILISFILGGIINPSPRVQDQVMLAGPMILTYQIGVLIIWYTNRKTSRPGRVISLREQDEATRAERLARFHEARAALERAQQAQPAPAAIAPAATPQPTPVTPVSPAHATAPPVSRSRARATPPVTPTRRQYIDISPRRAPARPIVIRTEEQLSPEA